MLNYPVLNHIFRALADPTRRRILEQLCEEDASVTLIAGPLPISLAGVMQHLRVLEKAGLMHTHKSGRVRTCYLEPQALDLLDEWIAQCRGRWQRRQPRM
jgi:DNA-binding transcriptional ArsR family regulator